MKNKHLVLTIGLLILSQSILRSQEIKIGIMAGYVLSNAHDLNKPGSIEDRRIYYPMSSFNIIANIEYRGTGILGYSIEPGYIVKGGKEKIYIDGEDKKASLS